MNKIFRIIQNYLVFAIPLVMVVMIWGTFESQSEIAASSSIVAKVVWELLSWNLMFWFATLILFLIILVAIPAAREKTLKRLANLKERDEREALITGKAAKTTYISTLSVLILFLFFSVFSVQITQLPENKAIDGKTKTVSIGLHFSLVDEANVEKNTSDQILFDSKGIPLSKSAIILMILMWQILSFNKRARKEAQRGLQ